MSVFPPVSGGTPDSFVFSPRVLYASPDGNDSTGDGSQFSPYEHISQAVAHAEDEGGGTVRIARNTRVSTVQGAGLWLRGTNDTGVGGAGWMPCSKAMSFEPWAAEGAPFSFGVSPFLPGGDASTFTSSPLWITGILSGLSFKNIQGIGVPGGPGLRLGLSSPLLPWSDEDTYQEDAIVSFDGIGYLSLVDDNLDNQPDESPSEWLPIRAAIGDGLSPSLTAMVRFADCYFDQTGADAGPAVDIGEGFWFWWDQCVFSHVAASTDRISNSSIRCYNDVPGFDTFGATYLSRITNSRFGGGGIYLYGGHEMNLADCVAENMSHDLWYGVNASTGSSRGVVERCTFADSDPSRFCVNQEGLHQIHVIDSDRSTGNVWIDSMAHTVSPISIGAAGRIGPAIEAYHEGAVRLHSPGSPPYKNIANALQWFTGTYEVGPDGAAAGTHTAKEPTQQYFLFKQDSGWDEPSVGDYYAFGLWVKWNVDPTAAGFIVANIGTDEVEVFLGGAGSGGGVGTHVLGAGENVNWCSRVPAGINRWTWYSGWIRVDAIDPGAILAVLADPGVSIVIAKPWCIHIPASDGLSDGEVAAMAMFSSPSPNCGENTLPMDGAPPAPDVGTVAFWPGQKLAFWDATLEDWKYLSLDNGAVVIS